MLISKISKLVTESIFSHPFTMKSRIVKYLRKVIPRSPISKWGVNPSYTESEETIFLSYN